MTHKILILCQRKSGPLKRNRKVEEVVVPPIQTLVEELVGNNDYKIDYLSDKSIHIEEREGEVDFLGTLKEGNEFTRDFLEKNQESYSIIILNTCPFQFMDYNPIYKLLKNDGLMLFTSYPLDIINTGILIYFPPKNLFSRIENDTLIMYRKVNKTNLDINTRTGGRRDSKRRHLSRKKRLLKKKNTRRTKRILYSSFFS
jgi:hypothetical protein